MSASDTRIPPANSAGAVGTKRRTQRVQIAMPIRVSGGQGSSAFDELTKTATVSAHGCLVLLDAIVSRSADLLIVNPATLQEVRGSVVFIEEENSHPRQVGIEFAEPSPRFWGITFPPADWDPAERKLPSIAAPRPPRPQRLRK
jgi:hypothetical protein